MVICDMSKSVLSVCACDCKLSECQVLYHDRTLLLDSQHCRFVFRRPVVQFLAQMLTVVIESLGDYWNNAFRFILTIQNLHN
jgi:hypothetical protein